MKTQTLLAASVTLNALLVGTAGYFGPRVPPGKSLDFSARVGLIGSRSHRSDRQHPILRPLFLSVRRTGADPGIAVNFRRRRDDSNPVIAFPGRTAPLSVPSTNAAAPIADNADAGVPVESSAPGNSLHFRGMRVAIAENLGTGPAGQPGLAVDVTPEASANAGSEANSAAADSPATSSSDNAASAQQDSATAAASAATRRAQAVATADSVTADPTTTSETAAADQPSETPRRSRLQVFTPEEILFRTKWGWAAFDLMRREAAREAANQPTAAN